MKREVFSVLLALSLVSCSRAEEPAKVDTSTNAAPKIQFDRMVYDFGSTTLVQQLVGSFIISNAGNAVLEISKPAPQCGCTLAALKLDKLAPGETTDLSFTLNVATYVRGGRPEKHINIPSNDPKTPNANLTIKANLVFPYEFNPQQLAVGNFHLGLSTNFTVQIKQNEGKPLGIVRVDVTGANAESVHPKLITTPEKPESATVEVEIVSEGNMRQYNNAINLYTADATQPIFAIPVYGRVVGDVSLMPEQLSWGIPDPENWPGQWGPNATTRKVSISSGLPGQKLEVSNVSCSIPEMKLSLNPASEGKAVELTVVLDKSPKETTRGVIKFQTNVKNQPTIEIPVTINVMKRG